MKKIITLAFLLALVAVMAVPMAAYAASGTTTVGGSVVGGTISVTPPSAIAFGTLKLDDSPIAKTATTPGRITVTTGTSGADDWTCSAKCLTDSKLKSGSTALTYELLIKENGSTYSSGAYHRVDGPAGAGTVGPGAGTAYAAGDLIYDGAGSVTDLSFAVLQHVSGSDTTAGTYSITITFTATLDVV